MSAHHSSKSPDVRQVSRYRLTKIDECNTQNTHRETIIPQYYFACMSADEAVLFAFLKYQRDQPGDTDLFDPIYCDTSDVAARFFWSHAKVERTLRRLKNKKFITSAMIGYPAKRQIQVLDYVLLNAAKAAIRKQEDE